jgi:hypothetical protein
MTVPQILPKTHALLIRQTAMNGTGLGPVIYANKNGVERAAIFSIQPGAPYQLDTRGTVLEDVHYKREDNRIKEVQRIPLTPEQFYKKIAA